MTHNYNSFQLIKFIYGEGFVTDIFEVEHAIENNSNIKAEFELLKQSKSMLPKVSFSPPASVIDNILKYSQLSMQIH